MYDLFLRIGQVSINDLREAFGNYIKTYGRALVIDPDKDDKLVDELLEFKEKLDHFLHMTERDILSHAGKISHETALEKARNEYAKYQEQSTEVIPLVEQHFFEALKQIETIDSK